MYKVPTSVLKEAHLILKMYTNSYPSEYSTGMKDLGTFLTKRRKKAEKLIKLLEENYELK